MSTGAESITAEYDEVEECANQLARDLTEAGYEVTGISDAPQVFVNNGVDAIMTVTDIEENSVGGKYCEVAVQSLDGDTLERDGLAGELNGRLLQADGANSRYSFNFR